MNCGDFILVLTPLFTVFVTLKDYYIWNLKFMLLTLSLGGFWE
eukprot:SAG31_NODE_2864_length_4981_cov_13.965178_3_plen_43_part_00